MLTLIGLGMFGSMFIYVYIIGIKYINRKFESIPFIIFAHIFYFLTFIPLFLIYVTILLFDTFKMIKMVREMAMDKNVKFEDFLVVFNKHSWLLNVVERRTLPDMAFQVRNSK